MITPILHRIILKLDPLEVKTESGIILTVDEKKERKAIETGTVIAIGDTAFKDYGGDASTIKVGDRVVIARYSGKEVRDGDVEYVVVNDEDILVKLGE